MYCLENLRVGNLPDKHPHKHSGQSLHRLDHLPTGHLPDQHPNKHHRQDLHRLDNLPTGHLPDKHPHKHHKQAVLTVLDGYVHGRVLPTCLWHHHGVRLHSVPHVHVGEVQQRVWWLQQRDMYPLHRVRLIGAEHRRDVRGDAQRRLWKQPV